MTEAHRERGKGDGVFLALEKEEVTGAPQQQHGDDRGGPARLR